MKTFSTHALASVALVVMLLVGLFAFTSDAYAQATDPESVFNAFNAAVNAHDVDTQLAFFADDALAQFPNQPPPNSYRGKQEIRSWLQNDAAEHIQIKTENVKVNGDTLMATAKVDVDGLRPLGITLEGTVEVVIQGGKIKSFTYTLSQGTLAKLQAATAPPSLPRTGETPYRSWVLVIVGLGILIFGLGMRLRYQRFYRR